MRDLRNEKIDRLERRLLKARRMRREEIRQIVSAPRVFDAINAGIKAEQRARKTKGASGSRLILPFEGWRKIGLAFAGLAVLLTCALGLIFFTKQDSAPSFLVKQVTSAPSLLIEQVIPPENQKQSPPVETSEPQITGAPTGIEEVKNPTGNNLGFSERIAFKRQTSKSPARALRAKAMRRLPRPEREAEGEFYPLAFAENLEEAKDDGQIIRVELSRSSLLALGLNPPLDGQAVTVKTDLLVGSDGVARGIRFVK